jgi:acyl carrier protein
VPEAVTVECDAQRPKKDAGAPPVKPLLGHGYNNHHLQLPNSCHLSQPFPSLFAMPTTTTLSPAELELATVMVKTLNLEVAPADIDPEAPIYGEGLGLDSIDILEISLAVSKHYGFQLKSDDENNKVIYRSVRNLSAHVEAHRTK